MKQLFRCEYCTKQGTAEEITKHEEACLYNYNKKSCFTCKHRQTFALGIICKKDKEIPTGKYFENCPQYEWDKEDHANEESLFAGIGF